MKRKEVNYKKSILDFKCRIGKKKFELGIFYKL